MSELILKFLFRFLKRIFMAMLTGFSLLNLVACEGGGGSDSGATAPILSPSPSPKSIDLESGGNFSCFVVNGLSGQVWCRATDRAGIPDPMTLSTLDQYVLAVESSSPITDLLVLDDTLCWQTLVSQRPVSRDAGVSTYCVGEATINAWGLSGQPPSVYGGPQYSHAVHGSVSLAYDLEPFLAVESLLSTMMGWSIFIDGSASVTSQTLSCSQLSDVLTCGGFVVSGVTL